MTKNRPDVASSDQSRQKPAGLVLLPSETFVFCIVSFLDVAMTLALLLRREKGFQFVESNPIAAYFLYRWGIEGMAWFKAAMTCLVCVIAQIVARSNLMLARFLLAITTLIVLTVVTYSLWLNFIH